MPLFRLVVENKLNHGSTPGQLRPARLANGRLLDVVKTEGGSVISAGGREARPSTLPFIKREKGTRATATIDNVNTTPKMKDIK